MMSSTIKLSVPQSIPYMGQVDNLPTDRLRRGMFAPHQHTLLTRYKNLKETLSLIHMNKLFVTKRYFACLKNLKYYKNKIFLICYICFYLKLNLTFKLKVFILTINENFG